MKNIYFISALCGIFGTLLVNATLLQAYHPFLFGMKECRKGPSHWCSNFSNAKDCYAIQYCIYTVWEKQIVPQNNKTICQSCLNIVKKVRIQFNSHKTEDDLKVVFQGHCQHIRVKPLQKECMKLIDNFTPEISEILLSRIPSEVACSVLDLCNNSHDDKMLIEDVSNPTVTEETKIITSAVEITTQKSPKDNRNEGNVGVDFHKKLEDNEIFYNAIDSKIIPIDGNEQDVSSECSMCVKLVKEVEAKITNKNSKEQIKHAMEMVCQKHRLYKNKCLQYIKIHGEQIESFIMKGYSQRKICSLLEWCTSWEILDSRNNEDIAVDTGYDKTLSIETAVTASPSCVLCEFIMLELEQELSNRKFQDKIKSIVQAICRKMPKTIAVSCNKFIEDYSDLVINVIDSVPPKEICQKINLCARINNTRIFTDKSSKTKIWRRATLS